VKILNIILVALITLLSIAAGVAKVLESPQEVEFLQGFGFTPLPIITFGLVQIVGGVLLAAPKTKKLGAIITILAFGVSTLLIFISGNSMFGLASMVPILLICVILWHSSKVTHKSG
jgi:hypothetical protein